MNPEIGVVVAFRREARVLFGSHGWRRADFGAVRRIDGASDRPGLLVVQCGVGPERTKAGIHWLVSQGVSAVVNVGMSGGLSPDLRSGDLVVADEVVDLDSHPPRGPWKIRKSLAREAHSTLAASGLPAYRGPVAAAGTSVLETSRKADLFQRTAALAVDMESAVASREALNAGRNFFILRAVCDPAAVSVPQPLFRILDPTGREKWAALFAALFRAPALTKDVFRLSRHFSAAGASLIESWQVLAESGFWRRLSQAHLPEPCRKKNRE